MTDALAIEHEVFVAAPPEVVFRFFVDSAAMAQWFGQEHTLDPRPGGIFRVTVSEGAVARGTYQEISPAHRIAFTWGWEGREDLPPGASLVEIELEAHDGGTVVRLRHSGLPHDARSPFTPEEHNERWAHHLTRLARHQFTLERREP
jgi:uncharacterized protein YndB with AHSA1/START domain